MAHAPAASGSFDELDPHGFEKPGHGQHHSHVIVGPFTLRSVLALLMVLTVLTVGQAQAELWFSGAFDIKFPLWVNIVVVMGIATVKALFVMAFFMQLRYDNPLNTIIMCFCFFAMALFLGFTSMDLLTRGRVNDWKEGPVVAGGTGAGIESANGQPLTIAAKTRYMEKFLAEAPLVEARLTARMLDDAAHHALLAAPAGDDAESSQEVRAAEAISDVAYDIRHKLIYRQSLPHPREFAAEGLTKKASSLSADGHTAAAAMVTAAANAAASGALPEDSKTLAEHDFEMLAAQSHAHGSHGGHDAHGHAASTKDASRGRTGLSGAVDGLEADGHGHDASHDAAHDPAAKPAADPAPAPAPAKH